MNRSNLWNNKYTRNKTFIFTFLADKLHHFDNSIYVFQEIYSRLDTVSPFIIYELRISTEMASGATKTIISSYGLDLNILL